MIDNKLTSVVTAILMFLLATSASAGPQAQNFKKFNAKDMSEFHALYLQMKSMEKASQVGSSMEKASQSGGSIQKVAFKPSEKSFNKSMIVTATAYTSHAAQTDSTPNIAAWGDRLKPGLKAIAVSRDLLHRYGLKHRQKVRIKGLDGEYLVLDKMNKRWRKKIDIYMGMDKRKAFKWGRRKVEIQWDHIIED